MKTYLLYLLLITMLALQTMDFYTTYILITIKGAVEQNPLIAYLMSSIGVVQALIVKMVIAIGAGIYLIKSSVSAGFIVALTALCIMYAYVVINHFGMMI